MPGIALAVFGFEPICVQQDAEPTGRSPELPLARCVRTSGHGAEYFGSSMKTAHRRDAVPDLSHRDDLLHSNLDQHAGFNRDGQADAQAALRRVEDAAFEMRM